MQNVRGLAGSFFFFDEMGRILERDKKELSHKPSSEEVRAGIHRFQKFGHFGTIYSLSQVLHKPFEQVLEMDYDTVFTTLWYQSEQASYGKALNKIINEKK